jgi:hypothetical protein
MAVKEHWLLEAKSGNFRGALVVCKEDGRDRCERIAVVCRHIRLGWLKRRSR